MSSAETTKALRHLQQGPTEHAHSVQWWEGVVGKRREPVVLPLITRVLCSVTYLQTQASNLLTITTVAVLETSSRTYTNVFFLNYIMLFKHVKKRKLNKLMSAIKDCTICTLSSLNLKFKFKPLISSYLRFNKNTFAYQVTYSDLFSKQCI